MDDCQIYVPLKKNDTYSFKILLKCLDEIKAWMALNILNFNYKKTEVMVFGGTTGTPLVDLVPWPRWTLILSLTTRLGQ